MTNLNFSLLKNGEEVQSGNTNLMLYPIDEIIEFVSKYITLKTGDIIFTGTPKGVSQVRIGDRLEGFIEDKKMFDFEVK
jgi:2-keto-4-pentenoate hydratase/2-oxohepta-3-ene-1,7-dioic acid hydratase in catechol pathway